MRSRCRTSFYSILFASPEDRGDADLATPPFFIDLNCDQFVAGVIKGKDEYNLMPFFVACLCRVEAIRYRHEVMRDLENMPLRSCIYSFADAMRNIAGYFARAQKCFYKEQKQALLLDAVEIYCKAVRSLAADLSRHDLTSQGFLGFRDYVMSFAASADFQSLEAEMKGLKQDIATIEYEIHIRGPRLTVRKYQQEADYSAQVNATFEKFKQNAVRDYRIKFSESDDMNHVEAKILEFVHKLYPEIFTRLDEFSARNADFIDDAIATFDREIQFYLSYLEYIAALTQSGLQFCYPRISDKSKEVSDRDCFDIVLARKLVGENASVVCNDFFLRGKERVLVISGPNQGGKTTFARMFGQVHYLASLGYPVPGKEAQLFLFDEIFTHFEKEEKVDNLRGKLEDDLVRIHDILSRATPRSIIIMNEIFNSTTIQDETFLSRKILENIIELDALSVLVTFVEELATFGPQTVSMVSTVIPENPAQRTFKVVRRPADGLAYAMAIARKYQLTYDAIMERTGR